MSNKRLFRNLYQSVCVYCGEQAGCGDHFPPRVTRQRVYVLPSCNLCNNIAGDRWPFNFEQRAAYVREWRLRRRKLRQPDWDAALYFDLIGGRAV